ncbi:MAG: hypothetical protein JXL67_08770 [Calditrichaeota bacterium]|nr:hypothetical protein [Calditrichota bacterium]
MELRSQDGSYWNTGSCQFYSDYPYGSFNLLVAIQFSLGKSFPKVPGLLDTASRWVVFSREFLESMGIPFIEQNSTVEKMHTRFGLIEGFIDRLSLEIVADKGNSISIDSTCFISQDWPGPPVIGWKGCLERIRFALDPSVDRFYFGTY